MACLFNFIGRKLFSYLDDRARDWQIAYWKKRAEQREMYLETQRTGIPPPYDFWRTKDKKRWGKLLETDPEAVWLEKTFQKWQAREERERRLYMKHQCVTRLTWEPKDIIHFYYPKVYTFIMKLPNGRRVRRKFHYDSEYYDVYEWTYGQLDCPDEFTCYHKYPKERIIIKPQFWDWDGHNTVWMSDSPLRRYDILFIYPLKKDEIECPYIPPTPKDSFDLFDPRDFGQFKEIKCLFTPPSSSSRLNLGKIRNDDKDMENHRIIFEMDERNRKIQEEIDKEKERIPPKHWERWLRVKEKYGKYTNFYWHWGGWEVID